jgi:hypothetical protein
MGGFWTFCWRSLQSNPAAAVGGSVMTLAGISYQDWLRKIADNPPVLLTNHIVQLAVIAFGVLVLAYVFYSEAQRERGSKPRPNWDMLKAIEYLVTRSQWSIGRLYSANTNHIILEDVDELIRDVAAQGRLRIWGRPGHDTVIGQPTEIEVAQAEWPNLHLDLTTMEDEPPHGVCARAHSQDQYCRLRVDQREVLLEWPAASAVHRFFDKTWKSRRDKITDAP